MTDAGAAAPPGAGARVRIERRGGLGGLRPSAELDCASLTAGQRSALERVFAASAAAPPAPGADRFTYRVQLLGTPGGDRSVDVAEQAMPAALAALVRPALP